jgi:HEAT repeat protein
VSRHTTVRRWLPCRALLVLLLIAPAGCRMVERWRNGGVDPQPKLDPKVAAHAALENPEWYRAVQPPFNAPPESPDASYDPPYRWRHVGVEDLVDRGDKHRELLRESLEDGSPVVAANAAVALARLGDDSVVDALTAAASTKELKLHARLAAVEALSLLTDERAAAARDSLYREFTQFRGPAQRNYLPELHEELLRGIVRRPAGDRAACFVEMDRLPLGLRSPAPSVRLAALETSILLADRTEGVTELAEDVARLRHDNDPRVRAKCLAAMAACGHPQAERFITDALRDTDGNVRLQAIAALGAIPGPAAREALERLLGDEPELVRVAAIEALSAGDDLPAVLAYAQDKSWRVRQVVARTLTNHPGRQTAALAEDMVRDRNPTVQSAVVAALADWPIEQSGPVLLAAIAEGGYLPRRRAAELLAERWPEAEDFPIDAPESERQAAFAALERKWISEFGPARARLNGNAEEPADVRLASAEAPIDEGSFAETLDLLSSEDVRDRREAARRLVERSQQAALPQGVVARLARRAPAEPDPVVLRGLMMALAGEPSPAGVDVALAALSHPTADIRRRGCEHLAAHGGPEHAAVLLTALEDSDSNVVRAALAAIGAIGETPDERPLVDLLAAADRPMRLEAAAALCQMGYEEGIAALERLTRDDDPTIRRQTALRLGRLGDPALLPLLIPLLDDHQQGVDQAALESLPKLVGRDVSDHGDDEVPPPTPSERISRWKAWWRQQDATGEAAE